MKVCRFIEWDMGHRILNHNSQCRNLHGHRYKAEICLKGSLVTKHGSSDEGMVLDFGIIKEIAKQEIDQVLDHSFMIWDQDKLLMDFFKSNKDLKHVIVPFPPTAENIASWLFSILEKKFKKTYKNKIRLESIQLWETPNNMVICTKEDVYV